MTRKVAVAIIHGIGRTVPEFADSISDALGKRCRESCGDDIVMRSVYWAKVLQDEEDSLWTRMKAEKLLDWRETRRFLIDFVADAIAYQITPHDRRAYDGIHGVFAQTLRTLAELAGEDAPLCIIAHSLGTIIASNYIYDLQTDPRDPILPMTVRDTMEPTPLEKGETISQLYTLGSPLALWSMRYTNFGRPVTIPDPRLAQHHPTVQGEWVNFYDRDDAIAFPLKSLNDAYAHAVTADEQVSVGPLPLSLTPAAHLYYWEDKDVLDPIAAALVKMWKTINGVSE